jgi:hypothetical protein
VDFDINITVGMENGVAAIVMGGLPGGFLNVFERTASGWVSVPAHGAPEATDLEVDGGTILASSGTCSNDAEAFRKNAAGEWVSVGIMSGASRGCDDDFRGKDVDVSGNIYILAINDNVDVPFPFLGEARIFEGVLPGTLPPPTILTSPENPPASFAGYVAIENGTAFAVGNGGTFVFQRAGLGAWNQEQVIRPSNLLMSGLPIGVEADHGFVLQGFGGDDYRAKDGGAVGVFQRDASGTFQYVAKLVATGSIIGGFNRIRGRRHIDMSGRTVVAAGDDAAYVFELPADLSQPELKQDDFEDGNAADWTQVPGGSFSVLTTPATHIYRQNSLVGNATSILTNSEGRNQSIQADIRPLQFASADRWFGLAVRYTDASNYYYVTARSPNTIQLRKIVNGVFGPLASMQLPITVDRRYRLRLEAVGTLIRLYVDGNLALQARDSSLKHGRAGVIMYQTRADYDNVVVTSNPSLTLLADDFETGGAANWTPSGDGAWGIVRDGTNAYAQTSLVGGTRSVTGVDTRDQTLQVRAKATAFAPGAEHWFGLMTRYQDDRNYYYLTVRNTNTISLRKLVNGVANVLDTATLTVTPGTWYRLRFEAIGNSLRAYVNNQLLLEANDAAYPTGRYGAVMFKAAARYDDFVALEP